MKTEHTPGPWHITDDGALPIKLIALDGRWKDRPGTNLGEIGRDVLHGTGDFPETLANARLIAAAPDMLAALNKIVNNWDDLHPKDLQQARAAIRRAKGEG